MKLKEQLDPGYTKVSAYVIGTAVTIYLLYLLAGRFPVLIGWIGIGIQWLVRLLTPVFWGFMLFYLLKPAVDFFERKLLKLKRYRDRKNAARTVAVAITCLLICLGLVLLASLIASALFKQIRLADMDSVILMFNQFISSIQDFYSTLIQKMNTLNVGSDALQGWLKTLSESIGEQAAAFGNSLVVSASAISSFCTNLLFTIIFAIYFLSDSGRIGAYWGRVFRACVSDRALARTKEFLKDADTVFAGYIRGQLIDALLMGVVIGVSLSFVGVKFSVIIGILAGIGNLIPYVGPFIAYGSTILVCLITGEFSKMILGLVVLFIVQGIDGNIINPKLLGTNVNIHPMYVVISLIIGQAAFGLVGMLFAVPVAALVKLLFDDGITAILVKRGIEEKDSANQA